MSNTLTIYNNKSFDFTQEYMFLGKPLNIQRYDKQRYAKFEEINRRMISLYWVPEEINLLKDQSDFKSLSEAEQHIFLSNLRYQIVMDSIQGRCPTQVLAPMVTLPELEGCFITQGFFETIHSRSYSHMIRNIFNDPSKVFDEITEVEEILQRANSVTKNYDILYNKFNDYNTGKCSSYQLKEALHDAIVAMNILEAIRFYISFACNLNLDNQGSMRGSAKIITLIARDEAEHKNFTATIIKNWRFGADDPDMLKIWEERKGIREQLFKDAVAEEIEWTDYLFKYGSMRGFNKNIAVNYLYFIANNALVHIGMEPLFEKVDNPIPWINFYFKSSARQDAPQDIEKTDYLVGAIKSMSENDYEDMKNEQHTKSYI